MILSWLDWPFVLVINRIMVFKVLMLHSRDWRPQTQPHLNLTPQRHHHPMQHPSLKTMMLSLGVTSNLDLRDLILPALSAMLNQERILLRAWCQLSTVCSNASVETRSQLRLAIHFRILQIPLMELPALISRATYKKCALAMTLFY